MAQPQPAGNPALERHAHYGAPRRQPEGVEFKYACTLNVGAGAGNRTNGEILVNSHYDFVIRRITWEYHSASGSIPKVRVTWKDNRRSYVDRPAFISACFGMPGEDFELVAQIRITRGTTLTFEATNAQDEASEIDIVVHGLELRQPGEC